MKIRKLKSVVCVVCGQSRMIQADQNAQKCFACAHISNRPTHRICIDCGDAKKIINSAPIAKRCRPCWMRAKSQQMSIQSIPAPPELQPSPDTSPRQEHQYMDRPTQYTPLSFTRIGAQRYARLLCGSCGAHDDRPVETPLPLAWALRERFTALGWVIKSGMTCPACIASKTRHPSSRPHAITSEERIAMPAHIAMIKPAIKTTPPVPSPDARAQRRDAHSLIEMAFDISSGTYRDGYSDAKISQETGAAEAWVIKRREEEFGPLGAPPEMVAMKLELVALSRECAAFTERMNAFYKRSNWPI
jgi:hypothetical protein